VVAGSKTREVVFGSEGAGDLRDVVYGHSDARGATACREHVVGLQGTRSRLVHLVSMRVYPVYIEKGQSMIDQIDLDRHG
jgi:hypothetical protein